MMRVLGKLLRNGKHVADLKALDSSDKVWKIPTRDWEPGVDLTENHIQESIKRIGKVRAAIIAVAPKGRYTRGAIDCPACGARVDFARYRNGHVHAVCATSGCVSWVE